MSIKGLYSSLGGVADIGATASNGFLSQWEDLQGPVAQAGGISSLTFEQYRDTPFFAYFMRHDQDDALYYTYQMRHGWKRGSNVSLHAHITPMSTWTPAPATKNIGWEVSYFWSTTGLEIPVATSWTTIPTTSAIAPTDQFKNMIVNLAVISPPVTAKESSLLFCRIRRLGSTGGTDTYTDNKVGGTIQANLAVWDFDVHYQTDKAGTVEMLPT